MPLTPSPISARLIVLLVTLASAVVAQESGFRRLGGAFTGRAAPGFALGDIDGDGDIDLVSPIEGVWRNDGTGRFDKQPLDGLRSFALALSPVGLGDLDGDGDLDLLALNSLYRFLWWENDGTGAFFDRPVPPVFDVSAVSDFLVADVDGNGRDDLLVDVGQSDAIRMWLQDPSGNMVEFPALCRAQGHLGALLDWNGDGFLDLVTTSDQGTPGPRLRPMRIHEATGPASLPATGIALPMYDFIGTIAHGDLEGDGIPEMLIVERVIGPPPNPLTNRTRTMLVRRTLGGQATFGPLFSAGPELACAAFLDLDSDQRDELVALGTDGRLRAWSAGPGGALTPPRFDLRAAATGSVPRPDGIGLFTVDLDGDGDRDLLLVDDELVPRVFLNDSAGGLVPRDSWFVDDAVRAATLDDQDGDGRLDLWSVDAAGRLAMRRGRGDGSFGDEVRVESDLVGLPRDTVLVPLQFDGVGGRDLFVSGRDGMSPAPGLLLDSPIGFRAAPFAASGVGITAFVSGNVDGGPRDELILARDPVAPPAPPAPVLEVFAASGPPASTLLLGQSIPLPGGPPNDLVLADLDGDGDLDLFVAETVTSAAGAACRSYRNTGGRFAAWQVFPGLAGVAACARDLDGDGDVDVAVVGNGTNLTTLLNSPIGLLIGPSTGSLLPDPTPDQRLTAGDLDRDGVIDLVWSRGADHEAFLGLGAGAFVSSPTWSVPPWNSFLGIAGPRRPAVGDLDGDGDLDLLRPTGTGLHRWTNASRQTVALDPLIPGRQLRFAIEGPANETFALNVSLTTTRLPTAAGTLWIDPLTTLTLATGTLDANGRGATSFTIPSLPLAPGTPLHWQTLHGGTRLGNLVITTLTR